MNELKEASEKLQKLYADWKKECDVLRDDVGNIKENALDTEKLTKMNSRFDEIDDTVKQIQIEAKRPKPVDPKENSERPYVKAYWNNLRAQAKKTTCSPEDQKILSEGNWSTKQYNVTTDADGGLWAPEEFVNELRNQRSRSGRGATFQEVPSWDSPVKLPNSTASAARSALLSMPMRPRQRCAKSRARSHAMQSFRGSGRERRPSAS